MRKPSLLGLAVGLPCLVGGTAALPTEISAQDITRQDEIFAEIERLRQALEAQQETIDRQQRLIEEQSRRLSEQEREVEAQRLTIGALNEQFLTTMRAGGPGGAESVAPQNEQLTQATEPPRAVGQPQPDVEEEPARPTVEVIADEGGVLTPRGQVVLEPAIEYTNSGDNVFIFRGAEIVDAILIGLIEASEADRNTLNASVTGRWGVTDRLELEAKIPYIYRDDRLTQTVTINPGGDQEPIDVPSTDNLTGNGIGDVELAAHYQMNDGRNWPFFIGNLRFKTTTGQGPFDVDRDANGVATELATGSGFYSVEPSITAIHPSDPAVFFGNLSYAWNIADDVDETIGGVRVGRVDPGDSIGMSFGMGFSINPEASFSFGYKHNYIFETETEADGDTTESEDFHVGALLLGASYAVSDTVSLNVNVEAGVTEAAPDVRVLFRMPIQLGPIF